MCSGKWDADLRITAPSKVTPRAAKAHWDVSKVTDLETERLISRSNAVTFISAREKFPLLEAKAKVRNETRGRQSPERTR